MGKVSFPLINIRKDVVSRWHMKHIVDEEITVPEYANEYGYYTAFLTEVPDTGTKTNEVTTTAPVISGLVEYRNSPIDEKTRRLNITPVQFFVNYQTGEILFHPNQAGNKFRVSYWGRGSLIEADDINELHGRIEVLEKQHDVAEFINFQMKDIVTTYEVGQSFPETGASKTITFEWETTFPERVKEKSISIINTLNNVVLGSGLDNTGSFDVTFEEIFTFMSPSQMKFKISAEALNGSIFEKDLTLTWVDRIFWGLFPYKDLDESQVKSLNGTKLLGSDQKSQNEIIKFLRAPERFKVIATPRRYPINKIIDKKTSLDFIFDEPYEISLTNGFGLSMPYLVHVSSYKVTSAMELFLKLGEE